MGKTMLSLFSSFDKNDLYQLYIYPSVPDVDKCKEYYRITDKDVLKGVFSRKVHSKKVEPKMDYHTKFENPKDKILYNNPNNAKTFRIFLRDLIWDLSPWYNAKLYEWIESIKPDCIFLAPGNYSFIYKVAMKISRKFNIKIVSYICDEFYFVDENKNVFDSFRIHILKKNIRKTMLSSSGIVTICDELKENYKKEFNRKSITIMTGTNMGISKHINNKKEINTITYMGNLSCGREKSIYKLGFVLDKINITNNKNYKLEIYTNITNTLIEKFKKIKSIKLHEFVSGEKFEEIFNNAEMFLHVEDFDEINRNRVKHSISTKIADTLASGIPLFAYGPSNVASFNYLIHNNCAIVATNDDELESKLLIALQNSNVREMVATNGILAAKNYHDAKKNSIQLFNFLKEVCL